ncbi:MAG: helix-turn-helix transcriptional regulator [Peptococcaceae bacterium]|nr:helix-turn-helix transcriptional regulator [Peptococcaceae bacterium]
MRLRELRLKKGLSKNRLAKLAGLSQTAVTFIEEGQRSPTLSTLRRLARALEVPVASLIGDDPEPELKKEAGGQCP